MILSTPFYLEEAWEDDEQIDWQQDLGDKLHPASIKYRLRKKAVTKKIGKVLPLISDYLLRQQLFQPRVWNTV